MRKRTFAVVGVALAVAAVAIWVLVGRGGDSGSATGAAKAVERDDRAAPVASAGGGDRGGGAGAAPGVVLIDDDPVGRLRLEGQVLDASDDPVGGAIVVLSSNPARVATTEDDGTFFFDGLVGRPYDLVARAPQGVAGPVTTRLTAETEPVILRLRPAASLTIEVVDDRGDPVDGATVELRGLDTQTATTSAGAAAIAPVVPGWYQLAAWAPGKARAYTWLNVEGEATARIALRRGATVAGRVVDEGGTPVEDARVTFGGASDWSVQIDERRDGQVTGADGRFRFDAVAAGSVRFEARHPDFAPASSPIVTLDGATPVDDVVITLPAGAVVAGTVVDAQRRPVPSARVRVGVAGAGFVASGPRQVFSDDAGRFEVRGLPRRPLEAVAIADAGASETVPVDASGGDVRGVELVVDVTGTIAGVVVDPQGEPVEGVQVSAGPDFQRGTGGDFAQWRLRGFPEVLTDAGGRFTLSGLAPGDYRVRAIRSERRRGFGPGLGESVVAKTGDTDVTITLPLDGGVRGKVVFADGAAPTAFTLQVGFVSEPVASKDGSFLVEDLSPGERDITVRGTGFEPRVLKATIESGKTADLGTIVVQKGRTIRGKVVAGGAPVAGATVFAGPVIFGNGSSNDAGGFGGPPGQEGTRQATTDERGEFTISGFSKRDVTVIAEHDQHGRSKAVRLPAGDPAEQDLTIALQPFGSMSGKVTEAGRPSEGVIVSVQSTTAPGATYGVASGADGVFRLDRLAPDRYKVSAMTGMNPMRGMGFYARTVAVESGKETKVDVTIERGTITLEAQPTAPGGGAVSGFGWIASGTVVARNGKDLNLKLAEQGDGMSSMAVFLPGQPARFNELVAGPYTVCLLPLPAGLQGGQAMGYAMRHGDDLPAFCKQVTVAAPPAVQQMAIEVQQPEMIVEE